MGNPPWDRLKLKQVDWFAARRGEIALAPRAADRRRLISKLQKTDDPLAQEYRYASERSIAAARIARNSGDYPMLSNGDINLYSLFVERAMTLVNHDGIIGLLVPSGIASDKTAARFFKSVTTESRLKTFFDFENKKEFFPMYTRLLNSVFLLPVRLESSKKQSSQFMFTVLPIYMIQNGASL